MAWYDEAVFYHIYPLGLTGAPEQNPYGEPLHRFQELFPWIGHIRDLGCTGLYIGPLFESVGHGYETTDYYKVDSRLGTNEDLKAFVAKCHEEGIRVILDGVFNHTGRDFFAFRDIRENRENSRYVNWYCNVNFWGNNSFGDGFSYENWGGFDLLAKLNLKNPEVRDYLLDAIRFWVSQFDIDGLRLDTADVLDFEFMHALRSLAQEVKPDFWLMGEVIHGDYGRWANDRTLNSVTNYHLHKALYSAHNDHNYFEIAHTIKRQMDLGLGAVRLYSFVDNHDVERIYTKLCDKAHFLPVHVLLYTLPGIPSIYYGSEFGIEGRKERWSDASLRPCLKLSEMIGDAGMDGDLSPKRADLSAANAAAKPPQADDCLTIIKALGQIHKEEPALWYGDYRELALTTTTYAFARGDVLVTVNNNAAQTAFDLKMDGRFRGALHGREAVSENGNLHLELAGNDGEIWIPVERADRIEALMPDGIMKSAYFGANAGNLFEAFSEDEAFAENENRLQKVADIHSFAEKTQKEPELPKRSEVSKPYEEMTIEELQAEILAKMAANGPVTDRMRQDVLENVYPNSLLNWVRSFR